MREKDSVGQIMPFPRGTSKDSARTEERRSSPRETLKGCVALVFFGEDNWGKLTNMSESGMAFEFAKPPLMREQVNFTVQVMGCMPMPRNGKALADSFEAPGEVVWMRDFERGAGVQFVDLAAASREQIRQWLSFETSANASRPIQKVKPELTQSPGVMFAPFARESKTEGAAERKETFREWDAKQTFIKDSQELESAFSESQPLEKEPYEASIWNNQDEAGEQAPVPELQAYAHPSSVARLTFLVVSGCLAAFAVTAGVRMFMTGAANRADAGVRASDLSQGTEGSTREVSTSSPVAAHVSSPVFPVASSSAVNAPLFQVEVIDASGRNWILWFVRGGAKNNKESQLPNSSPGSPNSLATGVMIARSQEAGASEKAQSARTFIMAAPDASRPSSSGETGNSSAEPPEIQPGLVPSSGDPFGGALGRQTHPAAPVVHVPTGGMVQQARLVRATLPVYPQLAKSTRASGDVLVDALIDARGDVTTVRVISGPVLLQQAAVQTVRQWKYEPARLDGQAVAMHLRLTVKFRLTELP